MVIAFDADNNPINKTDPLGLRPSERDDLWRPPMGGFTLGAAGIVRYALAGCPIGDQSTPPTPSTHGDAGCVPVHIVANTDQSPAAIAALQSCDKEMPNPDEEDYATGRQCPPTALLDRLVEIGYEWEYRSTAAGARVVRVDGDCSVPDWVSVFTSYAVVEYSKGAFLDPCRTHDYGYDLLRVRVPIWRPGVEGIFRDDMLAECRTRWSVGLFGWEVGPPQGCEVMARAFHAGVLGNTIRQFISCEGPGYGQRPESCLGGG